MTPSRPGYSASEPISAEADAMLERLRPRFVERRLRDTQAIPEMLERGEFARLQDLGHNLKGSGASFGFDGITQIGRALEEAARDRDVTEIQRQRDALAAYLERVRPPDQTA